MNKIEIKGVSKSYKTSVIRNLDLELMSSDIIALVGKNGEGKTTLLKAISHNIEVDEGKILYNGQKDYSNLTDVLLLPDNIILPKNMTIQGLINMFSVANQEFDKMYFEDFLEFLNLDVNTVIKTLSKGNQEIIQMGLFMANKPSFLLMDEPLVAVDVTKRNFLYDKIIDLHADGVGIVLSSHILGEIQNIFSKVIVLEKQKVKENISIDEIYEKGYESLNDYVIDILN